MHVCLPLDKAKDIIDKMDTMKKWSEFCLESIEEFDAISANPDWLVQDKAKRLEMILGTMHARISNLKKTLK